MNQQFSNQSIIFDADQARYYDLLREAEQYRLENQPVPSDTQTTRRSLSPIVKLLIWTKSLIIG